MRLRTLGLFVLCVILCISLLLGAVGAQGIYRPQSSASVEPTKVDQDDQGLPLQPFSHANDMADPRNLLAEVDPETLRKIDPLLLGQFLGMSPSTDGVTNETVARPGIESNVTPHTDLPTVQGSDSVTFLVFLREDALARPGVRSEIAAVGRGADPASARELRTAYVVEQLQRVAEKSQVPLQMLLQTQIRRDHVQAYRSYWVFNGFAVDGDLSAVLELAAHPSVEAVRRNRVHQLPTPEVADPAAAAPEMLAEGSSVGWHVSLIGADRVWQEYQITGRGIVVANMDSGVDGTHPALQGSYRGTHSGSHDYNWFDPTNTYQAPGPNRPRISAWSDHGTHTMGILMSVAPGAQWIALKLFDDRGSATDEWLHAGFQWCLAPTRLDGSDPNPSRAPHIVSNSWGDDNPLDETFRRGLNAWREAGIYSTWAAGNAGPSSQTMNSPAAFPEALGVGAATINLQIANFSSRGPSPWGTMIKPDVVAPGVHIRSTIAGGGFEDWNGTSMATPHAAGLAALLWEAAGAPLSVDATTALITGTASDIDVPGPDYTSGYGLIDAYRAVASVFQSGSLGGSVIDAETGKGIAGAVIHIRNRATGAKVQAISDHKGHYEATVLVGRYDVTASAFGYAFTSLPSSTEDIEIIADTLTQLDLVLDPLPRGTIQGQVRVADGSSPPSVTVSLLNTPLQTRTDVAGRYHIQVPEGSYTLRGMARYPGYRGHLVEDITITPGAILNIDLQLGRIPRLLLIDADAWLASSSDGSGSIAMEHYAAALDALLYSYDQHWILRPPDDMPTLAQLGNYEVVLWAQPIHSPGYIAAWDELASYLDGGGHLLISGQDIGYWDVDVGHGRNDYEAYLHAHYIRRNSALTPLHGLIDTPFSSLTLLYNTPDSAGNQQQPDAIAPVGERTSVILTNEDGTVLGLATPGDGQNGGVVYLSFGLEGVGPLDVRAALIERAVAFLTEHETTQQHHVFIPLYFGGQTTNWHRGEAQ
jgi:subtilisin family serine protease